MPTSPNEGMDDEPVAPATDQYGSARTSFHVGDQVRMPESPSLLIIAAVEARYGQTWYRVHEVDAPPDDVGSSWWVRQDELQPAQDSSTT